MNAPESLPVTPRAGKGPSGGKRAKAPVTPSTPLPHGRVPFTKELEASSAAQAKPEKGLDAIVTEYLRKQHALCPHPVTACPPFSLLCGHRCPVQRRRSEAPANLAARVFRRPYRPVAGGLGGVRADRRFLFSRFKPLRVFKDTNEEETLTACAFSVNAFAVQCQANSRL